MMMKNLRVTLVAGRREKRVRTVKANTLPACSSPKKTGEEVNIPKRVNRNRIGNEQAE